jgi:Na+-transporting NADH:ubiquinone oxidoreductase subunit C
MVDITAAKPFYSVLILALACSALVAGAAVGLRPLQENNRQLDRQKNILYASGLYDSEKTTQELFANIETHVIDLESGEFIPEDKIDPLSYNQRRAPFTDTMGDAIPKDADSARISRREKYSLVYLIKKDGRLSQVVLPVRGKGLWSTMYAYVALDADLTTIRGVSFYEHGETPGLGGEIENRGWQDSWQGKKLYSSDGTVALEVVKGSAERAGEKADYQIDGLSGATLTSKGVGNMLEFWFGDHGFNPFLAQLKKKDNSNG